MLLVSPFALGWRSNSWPRLQTRTDRIAVEVGSEQRCFEDAKAMLVLELVLQFFLVIAKKYASLGMFGCNWVQGEECEPVFRLKEAVRKESS